MTLTVVVNARGRDAVAVGIPVGYYGNAFALPVATSTAGELCRYPLSHAVELVNKAKNQVDMEYMRSEADLSRCAGGKARTSPRACIPWRTKPRPGLATSISDGARRCMGVRQMPSASRPYPGWRASS